MRIEDRLDRDTRNKLNRLRGPKRKKKDKDHKKKHQKNLSDRDIEDLMGVHRPRYYRSKGAYRQK